MNHKYIPRMSNQETTQKFNYIMENMSEINKVDELLEGIFPCKLKNNI